MKGRDSTGIKVYTDRKWSVYQTVVGQRGTAERQKVRSVTKGLSGLGYFPTHQAGTNKTKK